MMRGIIPDRVLRIVVWGLAIMILSATHTYAAGSRCPPYAGSIRVNFETRMPVTHYRNDMNITGIRDLFHERGAVMAGPHTQALGVTFVTPTFGIEGHTRFEPVDGGYCVYFDEVDADFGFRDMTVYVASEYPPGTCEYRTVLDHENQHVSINRQSLKEAAPQVRAVLEQILADEQPSFVLDPKAATREKLAEIQRRLEPSIAGFENAMSERNGRIDTEQNYKATSAVCTNWDRGNVWPQGNAGHSISGPANGPSGPNGQ